MDNGEKDSYVKKKNMIFKSVESMQPVVNVVNEAAALDVRGSTIRESAIWRFFYE